jgi:hypothetical protein
MKQKVASSDGTRGKKTANEKTNSAKNGDGGGESEGGCKGEGKEGVVGGGGGGIATAAKEEVRTVFCGPDKETVDKWVCFFIIIGLRVCCACECVCVRLNVFVYDTHTHTCVCVWVWVWVCVCIH